MQNPTEIKSNGEFTSSNNFEDMFDRMPIIVVSSDLGHAHF